MRYIVTSIILSLFALCANAQIRLVDAADGSPVQAASVFVEGGKCVGASGNDGSLPLPKGYNGAVTVQHINYGSREFRADTVSGGTVRLTPYIYNIPEVTAKYERPDYLVITAYVRQYTMSNSIPSDFQEGLYDFYVPIKARKGEAQGTCNTVSINIQRKQRRRHVWRTQHEPTQLQPPHHP